MKKRYNIEQIIKILELGNNGLTVGEICRQHNIAESTYYSWKSKYGGMQVNEAQRLRCLEEENAKLKRIVAEQALDITALKDIVSKKW